MSEEKIIVDVDIKGNREIDQLDRGLNRVRTTSNKTNSELKRLKDELRQARATMLSSAEGTEEYTKALARASEIQTKMRQTSDAIKGGIRDIGDISKQVGGVVSGLAGGFGALTGAMTLFGVENEDVLKGIQRLQAVMAISQGVATFANSIDSLQDLMTGLKATSAINKTVASTTADATSKAQLWGAQAAANAKVVSTLNKNTEKLVTTQASAKAQEVARVQLTGSINQKLDQMIAHTEAQSASTKKATVATAGFNKTLMTTLATMGLIILAITAVMWAVEKLIKWINRVPKDLEIKLLLNDEALKGLDKVKDRQMRFITDWERAWKTSNQKRLNELNLMAKKEFKIDEDRYNRIQKTLDGWRDFFKAYLKEAEVTAYNEALIKLKAEKWLQLEILKGRQNVIKGSVFSQLIESGKSEGVAKLLTESFVKGELTGAKALTLGLSGLVKKWNEINKEIKQTNEEVKALNKTAFKVTNTGKGLNLFGEFVPEKETPVKLDPNAKDKILTKTKMEAVAFEDVMKQVIKYRTLKLKTDEDWIKVKNQYITQLLIPEINKKALEDSIEGVMKSADETIKRLMSEVIDDSKKYVQAGSFWDFLTPQDFDQERTLQMYGEMAYGLATITDSIVGIYDARLTALDNYYSAEERLIEGSLMSEEEKNRRLSELDEERYRAQKKAFEEQKKWREATVYLDLASGLMGVYSRAVSLQAPPSPFNWIQAGIETTVLLGQSIAQIAAIRAQSISAPSTPSQSVTTPSVVMGPNQTALTTREENLNMIQKSSESQKVSIVKVSEINAVQNRVEVRERDLVF